MPDGRPFLFEEYHENSKIGPMTGLKFAERIYAFFADIEIQRKVDKSLKSYADSRPWALNPDAFDELPFAATLRSRRSTTPLDAAERFRQCPVSECALSAVLAAGYAEISRRDIEVGDHTFSRGGRTVPSGGGLYPLEIYAWNGSVDESSGLVANEIYHFHPTRHVLERTGTKLEQLTEWFADEAYISSPPSTIILITGVHARTSIKYGERSYRFLLLEAGHVMQNMLLAATHFDLSAVPIGGFFDDRVARTLRTDRRQELPLYCLFLG